jgi:hypothetical protein
MQIASQMLITRQTGIIARIVIITLMGIKIESRSVAKRKITETMTHTDEIVTVPMGSVVRNLVNIRNHGSSSRTAAAFFLLNAKNAAASFLEGSASSAVC